MTGFDPQADSYILQVNNDVVGQTTANSIDPGDVGSIGINLANIVRPYIAKINNFTFFTGTGLPLPAQGAEGDYYLRTNGGTSIGFYRRDTTDWSLQMTLPLGIAYNDGIIVGLRTQIDVPTTSVNVSAGNWAINNSIYGKSSPTVLNYDAPEVGSDRIDTIYADTIGNILYLAGSPSGSPVKPTLPANTIEVDSIYVPSQGTGSAYLFSAGTSTFTDDSYKVSTLHLLPDGAGGYYLANFLNSYIPAGKVINSNALVVTDNFGKQYPGVSYSQEDNAITGFLNPDPSANPYTDPFPTGTVTIKFL